MSASIYLDNNATTQPLPEVVDVVARVMRDSFGNPGSSHGDGRKARRILEDSRDSIAECLGADPGELVFTSGGTESNNLALASLTGRARGGTLVMSPGEHPSVAEFCRHLGGSEWQLTELPVDANGCLVVKSWPETTRVAAIILAHNETGVVQDVLPLRAACAERGAFLHLDAVQAVGKIPVNFRELGAATLSFGAHKFHGPRGVGGLLVREGLTLTPLCRGGHQESERRPGTPAVALVAGMAAALRGWSDRNRAIQQNRDAFQDALLKTCGPAIVHGATAPRLPNTLNISFPGIDGEALLVALDLAGISCSLGTTCASGSAEPAPILVAMGLPADLYRSAIRFSLSFQNSPQELLDAAARIARVVHRLRKPG